MRRAPEKSQDAHSVYFYNCQRPQRPRQETTRRRSATDLQGRSTDYARDLPIYRLRGWSTNLPTTRRRSANRSTSAISRRRGGEVLTELQVLSTVCSVINRLRWIYWWTDSADRPSTSHSTTSYSKTTGNHLSTQIHILLITQHSFVDANAPARNCDLHTAAILIQGRVKLSLYVVLIKRRLPTKYLGHSYNSVFCLQRSNATDRRRSITSGNPLARVWSLLEFITWSDSLHVDYLCVKQTFC